MFLQLYQPSLNNSFYKGIADIQINTAKELTKLAGVIQVPFRAGNQFLGEGGLQVMSVAQDKENMDRSSQC
jgi:hypothetical protein